MQKYSKQDNNLWRLTQTIGRVAKSAIIVIRVTKENNRVIGIETGCKWASPDQNGRNCKKIV